MASIATSSILMMCNNWQIDILVILSLLTKFTKLKYVQNTQPKELNFTDQ